MGYVSQGLGSCGVLDMYGMHAKLTFDSHCMEAVEMTITSHLPPKPTTNAARHYGKVEHWPEG